MNNEIQRKITSLTLMAIMVAGGMTFAIPGVMPEAYAANENLFVSAENSQFKNYMVGPQVIEVVIADTDLDETNESKGEPDVTINGQDLRMVQATDGRWYGYFADLNQAKIADGTTTVNGTGLDFGLLCTNEQAAQIVARNEPRFFSDADGVAISAESCVGNPKFNSTNINVLRENKDANRGTGSVLIGQIGLTSIYAWPFIQLYELNPTGNVNVVYNKGGGSQSTELTFDSVDEFVKIDFDRSQYPRGSEVHATISDVWLNIDPTDEDSWTFGTLEGELSTNYQVFDENGRSVGDIPENTDNNKLTEQLADLMCENNCILSFNPDANSKGNVATLQDNDNADITSVTPSVPTSFATAAGNLDGKIPITFTELGPNSGVFGSFDESDASAIVITDNAARGSSATFDYNEEGRSILVGFDTAKVDLMPNDDLWNSGEEIPVVITDGDANLNSRADEDLDLNNPEIPIIPSLATGDPFTLGENGEDKEIRATFFNQASGISQVQTGFSDYVNATVTVQGFSDRAIINNTNVNGTVVNGLAFEYGVDAADLQDTVLYAPNFHGFNLFNLDVRSLNATGSFDVHLLHIDPTNDAIILEDGSINSKTQFNVSSGQELLIANDVDAQSLSLITDDVVEGINQIPSNHTVAIAIVSAGDSKIPNPKDAIVADFFSFGFLNDGSDGNERIANQIIRIEAEETGDNTSTFKGSLEYVMINQLNINNPATYTGLSPIADDPSFIVIEDLTDEDSPRVNYLDLGSDGVETQVADQEEAPSHSGVVSFDADSFKNADTVSVTLEDIDLNTDVDLIDIYTTVTGSKVSSLNDAVGDDRFNVELSNGDDLGRLLDITFDDSRWTTPAKDSTCYKALGDITSDTGLGATGFTLVETGPESGVFEGDFQIPGAYCPSDNDDPTTVTGLDIEVNYVDFRDASGEIIEVGDSAGVRANTGSVSLDRTVYPVPFGVPSNFASVTEDLTPNNRAIFPVHATGIGGNSIDTGEFLSNGDLTIHIRVNDPDFDVSASGEDSIAVNTKADVGPVKISVIRGADTVVLAYAGNPTPVDGVINAGNNNLDSGVARQLGPITEIAPDAGIFEIDFDIRYTDGPASQTCPITTTFTSTDGDSGNTVLDRFDVKASTGNYCILQGDILQVEYTDPADASGKPNTVTDSATFDLRNGVLQSDKSVYIIGSDMILTLIEPDLDLDNDGAETYDLDLIEWDSDAATISMGNLGGSANSAAFDPEPSNFRETGDSTGIFQVVIEIPEELSNDQLERGEEIVLEYTDWGPSGADYVGNEDEDVNLTIFTSNFGATVELDQKVYTWTDKVYMTIVAPDHNFDSDLIDEIGDSGADPVKISTRGFDIDNYKLVETGTDTGIFTGEVILTGFSHDADGDGTDDKTTGSALGSGPTDGKLPTDDDDGLTVSFEFSEDETVVGSSLIRWNIGEVQWLEASYPASGTGVVRVIDPDMNLDPEAVDNFDVDVWSDSDAGGIDLTVTETNEATGIFEGTVFFTTDDESSGHRLRVAEGDTVTAEYEDNTLPDPYTTADELDITATSLIGTVVPPLERAPAANLRAVDAFGNSLDTVSVDQQVLISADLANGQDREQAFAYLVQIQDGNGVTVSLIWITGSLSAGQSFSPASSWIPTEAGTYTATAFVWESVDNPTALSPPVSTTVTVQ